MIIQLVQPLVLSGIMFVIAVDIKNVTALLVTVAIMVLILLALALRQYTLFRVEQALVQQSEVDATNRLDELIVAIPEASDVPYTTNINNIVQNPEPEPEQEQELAEACTVNPTKELAVVPKIESNEIPTNTKSSSRFDVVEIFENLSSDSDSDSDSDVRSSTTINNNNIRSSDDNKGKAAANACIDIPVKTEQNASAQMEESQNGDNAIYITNNNISANIIISANININININNNINNNTLPPQLHQADAKSGIVHSDRGDKSSERLIESQATWPHCKTTESILPHKTAQTRVDQEYPGNVDNLGGNKSVHEEIPHSVATLTGAEKEQISDMPAAAAYAGPFANASVPWTEAEFEAEMDELDQMSDDSSNSIGGSSGDNSGNIRENSSNNRRENIASGSNNTKAIVGKRLTTTTVRFDATSANAENNNSGSSCDSSASKSSNDNNSVYPGARNKTEGSSVPWTDAEFEAEMDELEQMSDDSSVDNMPNIKFK